MQKCHCCQVIFDPFKTKPQRGNRISKIWPFSTQSSTLEASWSTLPTKNCFYGVVLVLKILKTSFHSFKTYSHFYKGQTDRQTDRKTDRQTDRQTDRHTPSIHPYNGGGKKFLCLFFILLSWKITIQDKISRSFSIFLPPLLSLAGQDGVCTPLHWSDREIERDKERGK